MVARVIRVHAVWRSIFLAAGDEDAAYLFEAVEGGYAIRPAVFELFNRDTLRGFQTSEIVSELFAIGHGVERLVSETLQSVRTIFRVDVLQAVV